MTREDILRMARDCGINFHIAGWPELERFAALVADSVHATYSPIGKVAGGATERTFMHPSVKFVLPTGLQLYARIEVREEDKI